MKVDRMRTVHCRIATWFSVRKKVKVIYFLMPVQQEGGGVANSDFIGFAGLRLGKLWRHPQNRIDEEIQIQIQMQIQIQAIVCACESC